MYLQELADEENLIDSLIRELLDSDKVTDDELKVELHGHPADCLDTPEMKRRTKALRAMKFESAGPINGNDYFTFEIMRTCARGIRVNKIMGAPSELYLLDFGMKRAWISGKKLKSLLDVNAKNGFIQQGENGNSFFVRLSIKYLLDNAIKYA